MYNTDVSFTFDEKNRHIQQRTLNNQKATYNTTKVINQFRPD